MSNGPGNYFYRSGGGGSSSGSSVLSVVSKTTTYLATTSDDVILCSGSAFTVTLYAASGNVGKVLRIKKTDASLTNIITIDGNLSETIDGATTVTLNTQYENYTIVCDGSNWSVLDHVIPSVMVAYTPTFTGFGTVSAVSFKSRRVGDHLEVVGQFVNGGTPTGVPAQITLGYNGVSANVSIDSAKTPLSNVVGVGLHGVSSTTFFGVYVQTPGTLPQSFINLGIQTSTTNGVAVANGNTFTASTVIEVNFKVPIVGWGG